MLSPDITLPQPHPVFASLSDPSCLHSPCCPSPGLHWLGSHDRGQGFATVASAPIHLLPVNQFSQLSMEMGSRSSHQPFDHRSLPVVPLECHPPHPRCSGPQTEVGCKLTEAILAQFELGVEGLHAYDQHYITRDHDHILALLAANQKAWLSGICCMACDFFLASEAKELEATQAMMLNWLTTIPTTLSLPGLPNGLGPSLPNSVIGLRCI